MSILNDYRRYSENPDDYEQWKQERDYEYRKQEIDDLDSMDEDYDQRND